MINKIILGVLVFSCLNGRSEKINGELDPLFFESENILRKEVNRFFSDPKAEFYHLSHGQIFAMFKIKKKGFKNFLIVNPALVPINFLSLKIDGKLASFDDFFEIATMNVGTAEYSLVQSNEAEKIKGKHIDYTKKRFEAVGFLLKEEALKVDESFEISCKLKRDGKVFSMEASFSHLLGWNSSLVVELEGNIKAFKGTDK